MLRIAGAPDVPEIGAVVGAPVTDQRHAVVQVVVLPAALGLHVDALGVEPKPRLQTHTI